VLAEIVQPTVRALREAGTPFSGVLYAGLMLTAEGPKLVEYNARFGDPECQVLMARLESDLLEVMLACAEGRLADVGEVRFREEAALTVVMAARGYPGRRRKAGRLRGSAGPVRGRWCSGGDGGAGGGAGGEWRARAERDGVGA
jgi:phosphoribosylamine--glycine ligase